VHIIANKRHFDKLTQRGEAEGSFEFKIHEINELLARDKIEIPDEQDFSSGLFCYMASKKLTLNHYAKPSERRYFQHHRAGLVLRAASIALIAIGLGIAMTSAVKGWIYQQTVVETALIEQKYKAKFNQLSENRIDSTTSTTSMQPGSYPIYRIPTMPRRSAGASPGSAVAVPTEANPSPRRVFLKWPWSRANLSTLTVIFATP